MQKRMSNLRWVLILMITGSLIISCEDVINVNLKDATPRLVIDGRITNLSDTVKIMLNKSTDYFTPSQIGAVTNGIVKITDSHGISNTLSNNLNGTYLISNIHANPGDSFTLDVLVDGINYTAAASMPVEVRIDTLIIDERPGRPKENQLNIYFRDPFGIANYYQVKVFKNDSLLNSNNEFALFSDKYYDGKSIFITIGARRLNIQNFEPNDRIKVQLINIDKMLYEYLQILHDITDAGILSASTPSNPPNNISNGALGYFAAVSVSEKTIIVK